MGSISELGRCPGERDGNPLQYSCLENPIDRGAWWLQSMWSQRVGHDWVTSTVGALTHYFMNRRKECCPKFKRSQIFLGKVKTSIFFPCFVHRLHAVEKEIVKAKFQICEVLSNEFLWSFIKVRITGSKTNILFKDLNAYIQNIVKSICWLDLLPIKRTLKSLLLHHSSKVSILW